MVLPEEEADTSLDALGEAVPAELSVCVTDTREEAEEVTRLESVELLRADPLPPYLEETLPELLLEGLGLELRVFLCSIVAVAARRVAVSRAGVAVPLSAAEAVAFVEERPLELALTEATVGDFDRRTVTVGSTRVRVTYALSVPP